MWEPDCWESINTTHRLNYPFFGYFQDLPESQRADAVASMVYEAGARIRDPVYGCAGAICQLQKQVSDLQAQLAKAQAEVVNMQMQCQQANLVAMLWMEVAAVQSHPQQQPPPPPMFLHSDHNMTSSTTMNNNSSFLDDTTSLTSFWDQLLSTWLMFPSGIIKEHGSDAWDPIRMEKIVKE